MKNNDIQDENFGKEIPDPKDTPWPVQFLVLIVVACLASVLVALTIRLDRWLMH